MHEYSRKNLNIKRLLEMGDLDIRGVAERDEKTIADEYFERVESFIQDAPRIREMLKKYSDIGSNTDVESLKDHEELKQILSGIGYDKINPILDSIGETARVANWQMTARFAEQASAMLNTLIERLGAAYTPRRFASVVRPGAAEPKTDFPISLKEALRYLDYEEANRKLRILAVDDVAVILSTITSVLSPYYEIFALKSSSQVEKFLTHTTPELFLLDIEMNEINGFDLVPVIRRFEKHKDTPIIFFTGNATYDNLVGAIELGACDFVTKPINKDILLEKIEKNIVRKKAY